MTQLLLSPRAVQDLERLTEFLLEPSPAAAPETFPLLMRGLSVLKEHPLIGRKVEEGFRELVISRGRTGYVALYDYDATQDVALVHAIRHQREDGFPP